MGGGNQRAEVQGPLSGGVLSSTSLLSTHFHISSPTSNPTNMLPIIHLILGALVVSAHGDHNFDLNDLADAGMSYAERHVS